MSFQKTVWCSSAQLRTWLNYVEELMRTAASIAAITNGRANISHYVYTPLGGVTDAALIRDLLDLDAWLSTDKLQAKTLPDTRALLWETILGKISARGATQQVRVGTISRKVSLTAGNASLARRLCQDLRQPP